MIFVTVGTDWSFDRLIEQVDNWASDNNRSHVFAQIAGSASYRPRAMAFAEYLQPQEFSHRMADASVIVAHAGMGTILTALQLRKPIIIFPRRLSLKETRNDHQLATAHRLVETAKIRVAFDEHELRCQLDQIDCLEPPGGIDDFASDSLLRCVREFIGSGQPVSSPRRSTRRSD